MFRNRHQGGLISLFYSLTSKPLQIWDQNVDRSKNDDSDDESEHTQIALIVDDMVEAPVLELVSDDIRQTYISCPAGAQQELGIRLPILGLMIKNLGRYFTLEVTVRDTQDHIRSLRLSNFQPAVRTVNNQAAIPLKWDPDWNQVQLDLNRLVFDTSGTRYKETLRVTIHANCRLRRVYFAEQPSNEEGLPPEFRLYAPIAGATEGHEASD
ncbi:hypothetical protein H4R33_005549 [Dimargaris cristalligena]|uniref:Duf667-containing protein n=1 Tax=Dimargaris cristalligena TaxID=215637 RepID=A0A4P9ZPV1_9FUNG|nr:hypothetical protein H4R33_005549 [Dimargaris cristalligena]RKP35285.1 duf667-containing protein [Dimargaris cristalligena]|eukprot:RKP35285.1 duf667-containing protein [Dimargaris cristalligena]